MNTKTSVGVVIFLVTLWAAVDSYFLSSGNATPGLFNALFAVPILIVAYLWYRYDTSSRSYTYSPLQGGAVVLFVLIAIPYYLARGRPPGQKFSSVVKFFGLVALCLLISIIPPLLLA